MPALFLLVQNMTKFDRWIAVGATLAVCMTMLLATFTISQQLEAVAASNGPCLRGAVDAR